MRQLRVPAEASSRFPSAPKIGIVAPPRPAATLRGESVEAAEGDLTARMVSMNNVHRALPLTGVLGFAVAAAIEGTVVARVARPRGAGDGGRIRLISPSGVITAAAAVRRTGAGGGGWHADHASVRRTQRRLFDGFVYVPAGRVPELAGGAATRPPGRLSRTAGLRIPVQPDHRIRRKPITDSDSTRSLIPDEPDHRFRCQADHFFAAAGIVQGVWSEGARGAG